MSIWPLNSSGSHANLTTQSARIVALRQLDGSPSLKLTAASDSTTVAGQRELPVTPRPLPSAAAPLGLVDGLPVGAQFVASRYREDVALAAAEAVEAKLGTLCGTLWAREA